MRTVDELTENEFALLINNYIENDYYWCNGKVNKKALKTYCKKNNIDYNNVIEWFDI